MALQPEDVVPDFDDGVDFDDDAERPDLEEPRWLHPPVEDEDEDA